MKARNNKMKRPEKKALNSFQQMQNLLEVKDNKQEDLATKKQNQIGLFSCPVALFLYLEIIEY